MRFKVGDLVKGKGVYLKIIDYNLKELPFPYECIVVGHYRPKLLRHPFNKKGSTDFWSLALGFNLISSKLERILYE